jgi:hypothetical protein
MLEGMCVRYCEKWRVEAMVLGREMEMEMEIASELAVVVMLKVAKETYTYSRYDVIPSGNYGSSDRRTIAYLPHFTRPDPSHDCHSVCPCLASSTNPPVSLAPCQTSVATTTMDDAVLPTAAIDTSANSADGKDTVPLDTLSAAVPIVGLGLGSLTLGSGQGTTGSTGRASA